MSNRLPRIEHAFSLFSSPHAASWVSVIPSEGLGLHLQPSEFQVAIKWWLGLDTSCGSICPLCPGRVLNPLGHHALACKRGGDVVTCHDELHDTLVETCHRAHLSVKVDLPHDHSHTCPADILVPNWSLGKHAACLWRHHLTPMFYLKRD